MHNNTHQAHYITKTTVLFTAIGFLAGVVLAGTIFSLRFTKFARPAAPVDFNSAQAGW